MPTNRDIDEFESKVNNVHSTIQDLLSGKVDPLNVDIEFDDDEEVGFIIQTIKNYIIYQNLIIFLHF